MLIPLETGEYISLHLGEVLWPVAGKSMCNLHPAKMVSPGAAEKGGKSTVLCISLRKRARKIVWGLGGRGGNKMVLSDSLMRGAKSFSARRRGGKHFFLLSPRRTRGRGGREEKNAARKKRGKVGQGFPLSLSLPPSPFSLRR